MTVGTKALTLTISGGLVKVAVNDVRSGQTVEPDLLELIDGVEQGQAENDVPVLDCGEPDDEGEGSNVVEGFSRRSRNRCRAAGASLDWHGAQLPGLYMLMVTCTYPNDWRACAPTPDDVLRHRRALEMRYRRACGHPLAVMWKREFQDRGAPKRAHDRAAACAAGTSTPQV